MKKNTTPNHAFRLFVVAALLAFACIWVYMFLPTLGPRFLTIWCFAALIPIVYGWLFATKVFRAGLSFLAAFVLVALVTSSPIFHASKYYALLGETPAAPPDHMLPPIDLAQAPLVSGDMALQAMQKRLSDSPTLGSQYHVSAHATKQLVNGKLMWVAFLQHNSFFKWFEDDTAPGYLTVSAHDPSDVKLVQEINGQKLRLRYLPSAYAFDHVLRHVYLKGLFAVGLTDMTEEIDDSGRPYYVVTTYTNTIGFGGGEATGAVVVDVQTGDLKRYGITDLPAWVDRVQPAYMVQQQMQYRGEYVHGFINLNDQDRMRLTDDIDLVYGADGRAYWLGGMASLGKNSGLSGFYFVDSRTKQGKWFQVPAIEQSTAEHAAEHVNPEKKYTATPALPFMVSGVPTYVMALRDALGVVRSYGMVALRNNQMVAVGDTLNTTMRTYLSKQSVDRTALDASTRAKEIVFTGVVDRIASEYRNGQTIYFITLRDNDNHIFAGNSDLSDELVLTRPGDAVALTFGESATRVVLMEKFDNRNINETAAVAAK